MGFLREFLFAVAAVAAVSAGPMPHYNCPEPLAPANGRFRSSPYYEGSEADGYGPGHVIYYECDDGYELIGTNWDACRYDGYLHVAEWHFPTPVCEGDGVTAGCGDLDDPEHGSVDYDSTTFGSTATYSCDEGYFLIGIKTRICQNSKRWHGSAPVCNPAVTSGCGDLDDPEHGSVDYNSTNFGPTATYSCSDGLIVVGDEIRVCQADGSWSGDAPVCLSPITIDCGHLDDPEDGSVDYDNTTFGSTATYSCSDGLNLVGDEIRVCQADGSWSGDAPVCQSPVTVDCGDLDDPEHGRVDYDSTTFGSVATYSCDEGLNLVGDQICVCQANGSWSGDAPVCEAPVTVGCGDLDVPEHGSVDYDSTTSGSKATYSCDEGYFRIGLKIRICQTSGRWHGSAPVCNPIYCGSLYDPENGSVTFDSTTYLSEATYSCNEGLTLVGDETRVCQSDGSWSGDAPVCEEQQG